VSEDAIKVELSGLHENVNLLREEGRARGEKIDKMLERTVGVEARVGKLEEDNEDHKERFKNIEALIWKITAFLALALGGVGGAKELYSLLS